MKLIATMFTYSMLDTMGRRKVYTGSYLGRKTATRKTICAFMQKNGTSQWDSKLLSINSNYASPWIAR